MHIFNFVVSGPIFTNVLPNEEGIAVYQLMFRFWLSLFVSEIFAIELWSCPKSRRISHVFGPIFLVGRAAQILGPRF